jgi:cytochrome c
MKKSFLFLFSLVIVVSSQAQSLNSLTVAEKKDGWKLLFDGQTTNGWRNFKSDKIGSAWKVKDGALFLDTSAKKDGKMIGGGDIVTADEYENYELSLEWKIQACGNSGVIFNVQEGDKYEQVWKTGPEMQVLDNACHPDAKIDKHRAGNLYDLIESKTVTVKPAGEWNQARLISNTGHLEFWLNGNKQVDTEMFTPAWEAMIKGSKFKDMPDFGKFKKGKIALQDHGDMVWYRNIKIKTL